MKILDSSCTGTSEASVESFRKLILMIAVSAIVTAVALYVVIRAAIATVQDYVS